MRFIAPFPSIFHLYKNKKAEYAGQEIPAPLLFTLSQEFEDVK